MSSIVQEQVTVSELSKYGFKVNDEYINYSKTLSEADKGRVVPGLVFTGEFYIADSSKRYLNKILGEVAKVVNVVNPIVNPIAKPVVAKATPKAKVDEVSKGLSAEGWADKDRRISRQGLIQASIIALAPIVSLETLFAEARKLADQGLAYVNEK
jgi:hypothetical protein